MTKRNLLFVSLILVFGLGAMAPSLYAQGTVWSASSNQNEIRSEGDAEAVGTITLTTTSDGTIESHSGFTVIYTLPIAYYKPTYAVGISCSGPDATSICGAIAVTVPGGAKTVQLTFINPTAITTHASPGVADAINLAARVQSQGVSAGTNLTGTVTAFYKFGNQSLTLTTTTGSILLGLGTVGYPATSITFNEGPEYALTCIGLKEIEGTIYNNDFSLRITEMWNDAITSLSDEYSLENNDGSNLAGSFSPTYPTNGSDILITLSGLPADGGAVGVVASAPVPCNGTDSNSTDYCAGGALTIGPGLDTSSTAPYGPTAAFWYPVLTTNVQAIEWADFGFHMWSKGPLPPNQGYTITATVMLTDNYPNTVTTAPPNGDMPWFSEPETPKPIPVVYFLDCVTKLLFPYINTYGSTAATTAPPFSSFGTGIVISNTTWDPFALPGPGGGYLYPDEAPGTAVPQSGPCTFYFYPSDVTQPTTVLTYPLVVAAGGQITFDVAYETTHYSTVPFTGKQGYAIAICGFQNAHGFAEIYDNYANMGTTGPHTILGYIPEVLPEPAFYHRSPAGDGLGEGAIAPINIERKLLKELMGIVHH
jgi:hypothetical protein